ncbi:hypothetical protein E2C01_030192 [Portunus trituberculatus]|uniref:Uncharacterized protein n=1 Tax=Portunus trituberculatus TaxID=210409 RepID=A0A5B7EWM9_PORTR|nr:hypothetical protein [Portunus trituberculatus]
MCAVRVFTRGSRGSRGDLWPGFGRCGRVCWRVRLGGGVGGGGGGRPKAGSSTLRCGAHGDDTCTLNQRPHSNFEWLNNTVKLFWCAFMCNTSPYMCQVSKRLSTNGGSFLCGITRLSPLLASQCQGIPEAIS